ncbi:hypothetical protein CPC08DRAFT_753704 [Agrocybe pediades]|nr:hypothetical protein CPC08DRAFT_753704 [Agrocybe pediades]
MTMMLWPVRVHDSFTCRGTKRCVPRGSRKGYETSDSTNQPVRNHISLFQMIVSIRYEEQQEILSAQRSSCMKTWKKGGASNKWTTLSKDVHRNTFAEGSRRCWSICVFKTEMANNIRYTLAWSVDVVDKAGGLNEEGVIIPWFERNPIIPT